MKLSEAKLALIEKYLRDELSADDRILFDNSLKENNFKDALQRQTRIIDHIDQGEDQLLRDRLRNLEAKVNHNGGQNKQKLFLIILGGLIVAMVLIFLYSQNSKNPQVLNSNDSIYVAMYQPLPADDLQRGVGVGLSQDFQKAMRLYASSEYSSCLQILRSLENQNEKSVLYQAACHMELKEYNTAIVNLERLKNSSDQEIQQAAQWYLALSYLQIDENEKLMDLLNVVTDNPSHIFYHSGIALEKLLNE